MISFGSIVHLNLETLSVLGPAAPSEGVLGSSLASRPVSVRFRDPKLRSQLRDVISTSVVRQTTESASTKIFVLWLMLPRNRRAMTRLSKARTAGECRAITAVKAKAVGPVAVPGAADAVFCKMVRANAGIISFFSLALFGRPTDRDLTAIGASSPSYTFRATLGGCNRLRCPRR